LWDSILEALAFVLEASVSRVLSSMEPLRLVYLLVPTVRSQCGTLSSPAAVHLRHLLRLVSLHLSQETS